MNKPTVRAKIQSTQVFFIPANSCAHPCKDCGEQPSNIMPLVAAAILPAALVPMHYAFASAVTAGTVAAWTFASKIDIFFSGLASVGATAVVLPQIAYSLMLSRRR